MKSKFKMYVIVWAAVVVLFNVIVFITPNEVAGMSKFGGAFLGWICIYYDTFSCAAWNWMVCD